MSDVYRDARARHQAHIAETMSKRPARPAPAIGEAASRPELDRKIAEAYRTALTHMHQGGSVQVHVGTEILDYLKSLADIPADQPLPPVEARLFGFPLIPAPEHAPAEHISVHIVHHIF